MLKLIGWIILVVLAWHLLLKPLFFHKPPPRDKWSDKKKGNDPPRTKAGEYIDYEEVD
jgi:hypothetical protein